MKHLTSAAALLFAAGTFVGTARATPFWYTYDANDYPENEGWQRFTLGGGAQCSLADGC